MPAASAVRSSTGWAPKCSRRLGPGVDRANRVPCRKAKPVGRVTAAWNDGLAPERRQGAERFSQDWALEARSGSGSDACRRPGRPAGAGPNGWVRIASGPRPPGRRGAGGLPPVSAWPPAWPRRHSMIRSGRLFIASNVLHRKSTRSTQYKASVADRGDHGQGCRSGAALPSAPRARTPILARERTRLCAVQAPAAAARSRAANAHAAQALVAPVWILFGGRSPSASRL